MQWIVFIISVFVALWPRDETISGYADRDTTYRLTEFYGAAPSGVVTIRFPEEGRVTGDGPCNTYAAFQTVPYPWIKIGAIASTRKACPDLDFETEYFDALRAATLAEVSGPVVILSNDAGQEMVFEAE